MNLTETYMDVQLVLVQFYSGGGPAFGPAAHQNACPKSCRVSMTDRLEQSTHDLFGFLLDGAGVETPRGTSLPAVSGRSGMRRRCRAPMISEERGTVTGQTGAGRREILMDSSPKGQPHTMRIERAVLALLEVAALCSLLVTAGCNVQCSQVITEGGFRRSRMKRPRRLGLPNACRRSGGASASSQPSFTFDVSAAPNCTNDFIVFNPEWSHGGIAHSDCYSERNLHKRPTAGQTATITSPEPA